MKRVDIALVDAVTHAVEAHGGRREGAELRFTCPDGDRHKNGDAHPSASWNAKKGCWVCWACGAKGGARDLARRLGLGPLRSPTGVGGKGARQPRETDSYSRTPRGGLTLAEYAAAKRLDVDRLRAAGLSDVVVGEPMVRMPYLSETGEELAVRFRVALDGDRFRWRRGSKPTLYGRQRLGDARAAGYVVIVEGESDVHTLWRHGIPALGIPGAATWREEWAALLDGIPVVVIVIEPDAGGEAVARWLATSRLRERARLLYLPAGTKDPNALHCTSPEGFPTVWRAAMKAAVPWTDRADAERTSAAAAAWTLARPLLEAPDLLERVGAAMQGDGYAGDLGAPLLGYVAMTSRLLAAPMHVAYVAQSAAGKNRAVDAAAMWMPPEGLFRVSAGSPRALIYTEGEDFSHRMVLFEEADSIPDEGPAASAIRALVSTGSLAYDVVERDETTGRFVTRQIRRPGPTGLITTSTRSLRHQLGTRHLEVPVRDDEEQTRKVLLMHAKRAAGNGMGEIDRAPLLAVQTWLALAGRHRVVVPFAEVLAGLVSARVVRMRRDFAQLLTAIAAVALLHQVQRTTTADGAAIATLDDYRMARDLLLPIFAGITAEGLTPPIRDIVEAVGPDEEVTLAEVAERRTIAKTTASYRVSRAVAGGWLVNAETRRGHPARLRRGVPLPEAVEGLPSVESVRRLYDRTNQASVDDTPTSPRVAGPWWPIEPVEAFDLEEGDLG